MCFQPVMPNSVIPDSVMLNSYLMLYHILLYHFPLYLIPDCPLECYNRFLFSVIPDSIISDSVIPDSCFDIPVSVMPNSVIPDSSFACYNRFRYTRFPAPNHPLLSLYFYFSPHMSLRWRGKYYLLLSSQDHNGRTDGGGGMGTGKSRGEGPSHPSDGAIVQRSSSHWCSTNGERQGKLFIATEALHSFKKRMSLEMTRRRKT